MIEKFKKHLEENFAFLKNKKILLGVSAGVDSLTLLELLNKLNYDISLAHVNFKLREESSDLDEDLVSQIAQSKSIPLHKKAFNTEEYSKNNSISVEMAARELRYNWFQDLAKKNNYDFIAVAHHLNDQVETVLLNLSRGTGISGLTGMKALTGNIIRPLLVFKRKEIVEFAEEYNITWREDLSNLDTKYKRNKIRHQVIPLFEELNPSFIDNFSKSIDNFSLTESIQDEFLESLDSEIIVEKKDRIEIDIIRLARHSEYKLILWDKLKEFGFDFIDDISNALHSTSGKVFYSDTHRVLKDRNKLIVTEIKEESIDDINLYIGENRVDGNLCISLEEATEISTDKHIASIDADKITLPLTLRKRKEGDIFYPLGLNGKKKLSKFFKDEKYSLIDKEKQWLICSNNDIVWVLGKRLDRRFAVKNDTKQIVNIKFSH